jgi:hypothetical protein
LARRFLPRREAAAHRGRAGAQAGVRRRDVGGDGARGVLHVQRAGLVGSGERRSHRDQEAAQHGVGEADARPVAQIRPAVVGDAVERGAPDVLREVVERPVVL